MPVTNDVLKREENCAAITTKKKYYHVRNTFIKRSLRPHEWRASRFKGTIHVPKQAYERILNEAACMQFVRDRSDILVPQLYCSFEDEGAVNLIMVCVNGVSMKSLAERQRAVVDQELEHHLQTLHGYALRKWAGQQAMSSFLIEHLEYYFATIGTDTEEFVFCHNDLSQNNVIVDPNSLKITPIIDWEYAGFFSEFFECRFFKRLGSSATIDDDEDDAQKLVDFL